MHEEPIRAAFLMSAYMINTDTKALQAIGAELDLTDKGLGLRSRRYTMLVDDGVVRLSLHYMRSLTAPLPLAFPVEEQECECTVCRHACTCGILCRRGTMHQALPLCAGEGAQS